MKKEGDLMWEKITRVIKNWAYEEIEVEVEDEPKEKTTKKPIPSSTQAKVAYKYPRNIPLRFPLIQDDITEKNKQVNKVKNTNKNNVANKRKSLSPTLSYKKKDEFAKIENIPAYLRKNKSRTMSTQTIKKERVNTTENKEKQTIQQNNEKLQRGSTPDELDAIFRKMAKRAKTSQTTDDNNSVNESISKNIVDKSPIEEEKLTSDATVEKEMDKFSQLDIPVESSHDNETSNVLNYESTSNDSFVQPMDNDHSKNVIEQREEASIPLHLLNDHEESNNEESQTNWLQEQSDILEETLNHFNVGASVVNVTQGPTVTNFELRPESGVKVSRIRNLSDDLKLNLAAQDIRIQAPIPGKNTVGIEVPNEVRQVVNFQDVIENKAFKYNENPLPIALGLTVEGEPLITAINKMPHGLIAGATGSGKSVCINTILLSLIYKCHHEDVKFLLIDPKMIELSPYNGIPHLISPVITDAKAASASLKWAVNEMESRYKRFVEMSVRDITKYNQKITDKTEKMPHIVIVIDELADLMMVSPQDVEDAISRIAQKARAAGIHLLVATQRPSVDVITGLIKANIPTRIAFSVSSQIDSRTILDEGGAEKLLGKGDMLFMGSGSNKLLRLQGPFVSDEEIERVTNHARSLAEPTYLFEQDELLENLVEEEEEDELLGEVILFIVEQNRASASLLQRRFRIGYNRAARIIDNLEYKGLVSSQNGSKPRDVLISQDEAEQLNLQLQE